MRAFTIWYSGNKDETSLKKSEEFKQSYCILRLDIMRDALYLLENEYNNALNDFLKGRIEHEGCKPTKIKKQIKSEKGN